VVADDIEDSLAQSLGIIYNAHIKDN